MLKRKNRSIWYDHRRSVLPISFLYSTHLVYGQPMFTKRVIYLPDINDTAVTRDISAGEIELAIVEM